MVNNVKKLLEEKKISLYRLSEDTDITYSTIYDLAQRESLMGTSLRILDKIAEYLEVDVEDLYKEEK